MKAQGGMEKDMGSLACSSGPKSKNKPSKKGRDAREKKLSESRGGIVETSKEGPCTQENQMNEVCKKFILVDEYNGISIPPLNIQTNTTLSGEPEDAATEYCQFSTDPMLSSNAMDEYEVVNLEDEVEQDTLPNNDEDEDEEASDQLIRNFSPSNDSAMQQKILQISQE